MDSDELHALEHRIGRLHVMQRLGVEKDHEAQIFGQGLNFFHIENSALSALVIEYLLKMPGLCQVPSGQPGASCFDAHRFARACVPLALRILLVVVAAFFLLH